MDSNEATTRLDVTLKGGLLIRIKDVTRRAEKHDGLIVRQVRISEDRGIFRRIHGEVIVGAERADGLNAIGDGVMTKARRLGEDEDFKIFVCLCAHQRESEGQNREGNKSTGATSDHPPNRPRG